MTECSKYMRNSFHKYTLRTYNGYESFEGATMLFTGGERDGEQNERSQRTFQQPQTQAPTRSKGNENISQTMEAPDYKVNVLTFSTTHFPLHRSRISCAMSYEEKRRERALSAREKINFFVSFTSFLASTRSRKEHSQRSSIKLLYNIDYRTAEK